MMPAGGSYTVTYSQAFVLVYVGHIKSPWNERISDRAKQNHLNIFFIEVQSPSCEWLKPSTLIAKEGA